MSTRTRQVLVAVVIAASILLTSSYATAGEKKLLPAVGKITLKDGKAEITKAELTGKLADSDPKDAERTEMYAKIYAIKLEAGKTYQFDCSSDWDNWLRLEDAKGKQLESNDDTNGTNAQIIFECKTAGEYRIIVTSYEAGQTGDFTLTIATK